jgi:2-polyprenyl-6-methoxyphenol hydroxylase-like FAD-dependent oxidoreductase
MNTGIQDAIALGHALTAVVGGAADESRLDQYERTRRPIAQHVVAITDRMTRMATLRSAPARAVRNTLIRVLGRIPAVPRWLATELAGLRNR